MKNLLSIVLIVIGVILGWFVSSFFNDIPKGKVLVNQSAVDSLTAFVAFADSIENLPMEPVVTYTDTFYIVETKYVTSTPTEKEDDQDSTITHYVDSLVIEKEISVWVDIMVRGVVDTLTIKWKYNPIIRSIETVTERPVYKPVIVQIKVPKYVTGHYLSASMGGNDKLFTFGIDYDVVGINRIYGLNYRRYGDQNVYGVKIGINLSTLFKK